MCSSRGAASVALCFVLCLVQVVAASPFHEYSREQLFLLRRRGVLTKSPSHIVRPLPSFYQQQLLAMKDLNSMSVAQLKGLLQDRESSCIGCVERRHLVERALEVQHRPTLDQRVAEQLVAVEGTPLEQEVYLDHMKLLLNVYEGISCQSISDSMLVCESSDD